MKKTVFDRISQLVDWTGDTSPNRQPGREGKAIRNILKRIVIHSNVGVRLRYDPVIQCIRRLPRSESTTLLEVGSGTLGVTAFLRRRVVGLDMQFNGPRLGYLDLVRGDGTVLPFADDTFDVVLSSDVLEHIPLELREQAVHDMFRVSRRHIILGVPCGKASMDSEARVDALYRRRFGQSHRWLRDHLEYGLPSEEEMQAMIDRAASRFGTTARTRTSNNVNLRLWYLIQLSELHIGAAIFNAFFMNLLFFLVRRLNWGKCYRKVFCITLDA